MEMTEFNFIINFFRRGVVHILKKGLVCHIKMGGGREQARNSNKTKYHHLSFPTQLPKWALWWTVHLTSEGWLEGTPLWHGDRFVNLQISWWHSQVPWWTHCAGTDNSGSKSSPGKHKGETDPLFPTPQFLPTEKHKMFKSKAPCLHESQFDCRCFMFLVHHTNHSWPCAIIACFSLRSPPSAAIYIQGCAALITEPFVTNAFQDG